MTSTPPPRYDCAQSWRMGGDHTGTWDSVKGVVQNVMKIPAEYTGERPPPPPPPPPPSSHARRP
eukprot:SAG11_NODE_3306_length_2535_cov_4.818966_1_plen_63_part_10